MKILAVGMLDHEVYGRDTFFVQVAEDEVMLYEAHKDGRIIPMLHTTEKPVLVTASIEKFGNSYRVDFPVEISEISELPSYIGRFEIISPTGCKLSD